MNYLKLAAALVASMACGAHALDIRGTVIDESGQPLANVEVGVKGKFTSVETDQNGRFALNIDADRAELHFSLPGMIHQNMVVDSDRSDLVINLSESLIEHMDVVGLPLHLSVLESAHPVSVLSGDELREKHAATLGETLKYETGVHSTYYGGVSSSPIIRGLDGPRVLVAQNGLDVGDASRVGPDHIVSAESASAEQVEVLRGPATLFFGSGAIGGVVNVVDGRVPRDSETEARISSGFNSVSNERELSAAFKGGSDTLAFYADGFVRDADEIEIPDHDGHEDAEHEGDEHDHAEGIIENSASESSGFTLGSSWLFDQGFIGLSYGRLERLNGIPGHAHEEEHGEEAHDELLPELEHEDEHEEEVVESDLKQDRWQLLSQIDLNYGVLTSLNARVGYTEYEHAEIEDGEIGTTFENELFQFRTDLGHAEINGWLGALSFEYKDEELVAIGEEAFTPPSEASTIALSLIEEKHFGDVLIQAGFRIEEVNLESSVVESLHHDEGEEHEGEEHTGERFDKDFSFTPLSVSAGFVWEFRPGYNFSASLTHAERAPNPAEVFSLGPHIGTRSYEIGALYSIENEDGEYHIEAENRVDKEVSNNLDISLRKFDGRFGFVLNAFYNQISDFYYLANTGLTSEQLFAEEEGEEEGHEHASDLPVFIHQQSDATLYGVEAEVIAQITDSFKFTLMGDSVNAELDDGGNLPRIPPARVGAIAELRSGNWIYSVDMMRTFAQNDIAEFETTTDAYTLYGAKVAYRIDLENMSVSAFLKGENLTDEFAQVHSSFLKDDAPLPGRALRFGLSVEF